MKTTNVDCVLDQNMYISYSKVPIENATATAVYRAPVRSLSGATERFYLGVAHTKYKFQKQSIFKISI